MSQTPSTDAPNYLMIDPDPSSIILGTANLPSTLTVSSATNYGGYHDAIIQTTASKQPGWAANAIVGAYIATNAPGANAYPSTSAAGTSALAGVPGFSFNGTAQFFEYDTLASSFSGTEVGITVVCVVQLGSAPNGTNTVWSFSSSTATPRLTLACNSSGVYTISDVTSAGTTSAAITLGTNLAVISATRTSSAVSIRGWYNVSGTPSLLTGSSTITTPTAATYTTFCIGAQANTSGTGTNLFDGNIGKFGVYGVQSGTTIADIEEVEAEWLLFSGISRLVDIAQTSTAQEE